MDILKKMFKMESQKSQDSSASNKDEFRKPQWFEEAETDDELFDDDRKFAFQVFTSPLEMQKHFERQLQQLLESMNDNDEFGGGFEKDLRGDFLKPGFESKIIKEFAKRRNDQSLDTDLDGEIYADQLHSLIQRLNPQEHLESEQEGNILRGNRKPAPRLKLSDEETIMGRIHGTLNADGEPNGPHRASRFPPHGKPDIMTPMTPMMPRSGMTPFSSVFDGNYQGPKMFSQSVMTKTVRRPDGSYETTKVTQDSTGKKTTTVTRMIDGKQETMVTHDGPGAGTGIGGVQEPKQLPAPKAAASVKERQLHSDRNIFVTKEGYAMPRNLW